MIYIYASWSSGKTKNFFKFILEASERFLLVRRVKQGLIEKTVSKWEPGAEILETALMSYSFPAEENVFG